MKVVFKNISIAICLVALAATAGCSSKENVNDKAIESTTKTAAPNQDKDSTARKTAVIDSTAWAYSEEEDKMTSEKNYYAANVSTDNLLFNAPYDGGSTATLTVRNKDKQNRIMLTISKGQFMTNLGGDKQVRMRFDDNKPISVAYYSPSDGSSDMLFLSNEKQLISLFKKAKHLIIEVEFYNEGNRQIEFNIAGFKWDH